MDHKPLTIHRVPITQVHQHPRNPRNGNVDLIAESITTNGVYKPIITTRDGTILAGNHTYQAFLQLGHTEVDIVRLDVDAGSAEATRIMLADNRTSDVGAHMYDDGLLLELLEGLPDLEGTGYNGYDVTDLSPDFEPVDENPRLDELEPTKCPECGHEWVK